MDNKMVKAILNPRFHNWDNWWLTPVKTGDESAGYRLTQKSLGPNSKRVAYCKLQSKEREQWRNEAI